MHITLRLPTSLKRRVKHRHVIDLSGPRHLACTNIIQAILYNFDTNAHKILHTDLASLNSISVATAMASKFLNALITECGTDTSVG